MAGEGIRVAVTGHGVIGTRVSDAVALHGAAAGRASGRREPDGARSIAGVDRAPGVRQAQPSGAP